MLDLCRNAISSSDRGLTTDSNSTWISSTTRVRSTSATTWRAMNGRCSSTRRKRPSNTIRAAPSRFQIWRSPSKSRESPCFTTTFSFFRASCSRFWRSSSSGFRQSRRLKWCSVRIRYCYILTSCMHASSDDSFSHRYRYLKNCKYGFFLFYGPIAQ